MRSPLEHHFSAAVVVGNKLGIYRKDKTSKNTFLKWLLKHVRRTNNATEPRAGEMQHACSLTNGDFRFASSQFASNAPSVLLQNAVAEAEARADTAHATTIKTMFSSVGFVPVSPRLTAARSFRVYDEDFY